MTTVQPVDSAFLDLHMCCALISTRAQQVTQAVDVERAHIRAVLTAFYRAPISMSSVQPVLDLAVALNPDLKLRP